MANVQISESLFNRILIDFEERYQSEQLNADQIDIRNELIDKAKRRIAHNTYVPRQPLNNSSYK